MTSNFFKAVKNTVKHWYLPLIVGILFIGLGVYSLFSPAESYLALALLFSISFLVAGAFDIFFAISNREELEGWGWQLSMGILTLLFGILLINNPAISLITLPFVVGFVVLFRSINAISTSLELRNYHILDWGYLFALGLFGTVFAFILLIRPDFAGFSLVIWTGLALILMGASGVFIAVKLKKVHDLPKTISNQVKDKWEQVQAEIKAELTARSKG